jgi:PAS domain S-box-containing protein
LMARRLLPAMIGVLMVIGWFRLAGQHAGLYETEFGTALLVVACSVILGALVWWNAGRLNRMEGERKQAEEALRKSEEKYRTLFDSIDVGVCTIEVLFDGNEKPVDYRFLEVNPSFENQTGIQHARGRRMREIAPLHEEHWFEMYGKIALTGQAARFENQAAQLHRWYDVYAFRIGDPQDRHVAIHFKDITERKQAEDAMRTLNAQLEMANKELEAFSYSVSHDLRAPLRGIDGFSQALLEDYEVQLDDQGKDYLRRVRAASQRMAQLIDDILNLSRVTRSEMQIGTVDLSGLAQTIAAELQAQQPDRRVTLKIQHGVTGKGDGRLLRQALDNLLGNAWKFTSKQPAATIEFGVMAAASNGGAPAYFVRDNGAGFDMTYAGKLFSAFQRLHAVTEFPGTGIGLATVQRIVHRHGGRVWAESTMGQGATFYFTL